MSALTPRRSAERRAELQYPIGLATTYETMIDGRLKRCIRALANGFAKRFHVSPRFPTLIFFGCLLASHMLPLCGTRAAAFPGQLANPDETRRTFPRHLAMSAQSWTSDANRMLAATGLRNKPAALQRAFVPMSEVNVAPGSAKNVDSAVAALQRTFVIELSYGLWATTICDVHKTDRTG